MDSLGAVREDLSQLKGRLVRGEIDLASYNQLREAVLADLTAEERAALSTGTPGLQAATPSPRTPPPFAPSGLGPSGASGLGLRTAVPRLADLDLRPGTVLLEQWRLVRELGRGGFGAVFEAEELHLHERQAVKVLDPAMVAKEELLARFRREVSLMRKLVHPRIVRVYDYREEPNRLVALISMELVRGGSVKQLLSLARERKQAIPISLALEILHQTLEALAEAHSQGVIHRDVTPGNVLLAGGTPEQLLADPKRDPQVKLVDFGIAGLVERSELSQKSRVLGTAAYVAPEVLDPRVEVTSAADVYGAGAMAYELLTGELPVGRFEGVRELRGEVTESIDHFVTSLLEKRPEKRPQAKAGAWGLPGLREEAEQESQRRKVEQRQQSEEQARRQQETARREVEGNTQQVRRAAEWRAAAERTQEAARARPVVRPVDRSNLGESGSQTARRKGLSAASWAGIGLALVVLVIALGWGISSQRAAREQARADAARLAQEHEATAKAEARQQQEAAAQRKRDADAAEKPEAAKRQLAGGVTPSSALRLPSQEGLGQEAAMEHRSPQWYERVDFVSKRVQLFLPFDGDSVDWAKRQDRGRWSGPSTFVPGRFGQAHLLKDGLHYSARLPQGLSSFSQVSFSAWFQNDLRRGRYDNESLVGFGIDGAGPPHAYLFILNGGGSAIRGVTLNGWSSAGGIGTPNKSYSELFDGRWHHVATVWDGRRSAVYVDGALLSENDEARGLVVPRSADLLYINRHDWAGGYSSRLSGAVDEVAIFDRPLTASEVRRLAEDRNGDGVSDFWE